MCNELVAVTLIIVCGRIFERHKVEGNSVNALQKTGTKLNHKVIISV